jgi:hypothetical protein
MNVKALLSSSIDVVHRSEAHCQDLGNRHSRQLEIHDGESPFQTTALLTEQLPEEVVFNLYRANPPEIFDQRSDNTIIRHGVVCLID